MIVYGVTFFDDSATGMVYTSSLAEARRLRRQADSDGTIWRFTVPGRLTRRDFLAALNDTGWSLHSEIIES